MDRRLQQLTDSGEESPESLAELHARIPAENPAFGEIRKKLNQRVQASPGNARLLSNLAIVDVLLGRKNKAIAEGKLAIKMLPVSKDAVTGPKVLKNLAVVYAWTGELNLAVEMRRIN